MRDHRKPPPPEWWNVEFGICRWCGCCILGKSGKAILSRRWHTDCAEEYKFLFWPQETKRSLLKTRGGACEDCRKAIGERPKYLWWGSGWKERTIEVEIAEVHHIIPLIDYPHDVKDAYAAWRDSNLALLCHKCHLTRGQAWRDDKRGGAI